MATMYNDDAAVYESKMFTLCINLHTLYEVPYVHEQRLKD